MAGALAHGPQEAMGEVIQPVILGRRRSSDNIDGEVAAKEIKVTTDKVGAKEIENPTNEIVRFSSGCTAVMRMRYEEAGLMKMKDTEGEQIEKDVAPAKQIEKDAAPAKQIEKNAAPAKQIEKDVAPAKQIEKDLAPAKQLENPWSEVKDEGEGKDIKHEVKGEVFAKQENREKEETSREEEGKLAQQMMGSIVRGAVEGGSHLLQTWLKRRGGF